MAAAPEQPLWRYTQFKAVNEQPIYHTSLVNVNYCVPVYQ